MADSKNSQCTSKKTKLIIKTKRFFFSFLFFFFEEGGGGSGLTDLTAQPYIPHPYSSLLHKPKPKLLPFDPDSTPVKQTGTNHWGMERAKQTDRIIAKSSRSHTAWSLDFTETVITYISVSK